MRDANRDSQNPASETATTETETMTDASTATILRRNANRNIKMVRHAAKELRYAGYKAKADHCMVHVVVDTTPEELIRLQAFYDAALVAK